MIDNRTFTKSGPLPEYFLQGCGLSDWEIEAAKLHRPGLTTPERQEIIHRLGVLALDTTPIQYHRCFLSYNSSDEEITRKIHDDLQKRGVRTWFAPEDLKGGDRFRDAIFNEIRVTEKVLLVLSERSVNSNWVKSEAQQAMRREDKSGKQILFPIRLDDAVFESDEAWVDEIQGERHMLDFTNWEDEQGYAEAFQRLLRDLEKAAEK